MRIICLIIIALLSSSAIGSTSWGSPFDSYHANGFWHVTYSWGISPGGDDDNSQVICSGGDDCIVFPGIRSGLGRTDQTCDAGGACNPNAVRQSTNPRIRVRNGSRWEDAYTAFIAKYGTTGNVDTVVLRSSAVLPPDHPTWGKLCVGFTSLPWNTVTISNLAPSTTCGYVNPPTLQCEINIDNFVDMGVIPTGYTSLRSLPVFLQIQCSGPAQITAALTRDDHKLAGMSLNMDIDRTRITTRPQVIYK